MASKTIKCPNCGEQIRIDDYEMYGTPHVCPKCGSVVYNRTSPQTWSEPKQDKTQKETVKTTNNNKAVVTEKHNEYKPNIYAVLSAVFCLFLPWIIGYPFGVVGDNRAKYLGDTSGHRMAMISKIVSIVMMILYGLGLIISLWINDWRWGLPAMFGVLVAYGVYFGIAYYFHKH